MMPLGVTDGLVNGFAINAVGVFVLAKAPFQGTLGGSLKIKSVFFTGLFAFYVSLGVRLLLLLIANGC
jgi:hypothetical protein